MAGRGGGAAGVGGGRVEGAGGGAGGAGELFGIGFAHLLGQRDRAVGVQSRAGRQAGDLRAGDAFAGPALQREVTGSVAVACPAAAAQGFSAQQGERGLKGVARSALAERLRPAREFFAEPFRQGARGGFVEALAFGTRLQPEAFERGELLGGDQAALGGIAQGGRQRLFQLRIVGTLTQLRYQPGRFGREGGELGGELRRVCGGGWRGAGCGRGGGAFGLGERLGQALGGAGAGRGKVVLDARQGFPGGLVHAFPPGLGTQLGEALLEFLGGGRRQQAVAIERVEARPGLIEQPRERGARGRLGQRLGQRQRRQHGDHGERRAASGAPDHRRRGEAFERPAQARQPVAIARRGWMLGQRHRQALAPAHPIKVPGKHRRRVAGGQGSGQPGQRHQRAGRCQRPRQPAPTRHG